LEEFAEMRVPMSGYRCSSSLRVKEKTLVIEGSKEMRMGVMMVAGTVVCLVESIVVLMADD